MSDPLMPDPKTWQRKAVAFVTRSHRHLWGKNNESPQAFLFRKGLSNPFMKEMLIGWNKFAQERPLENWGGNTETGKKLFLPAGIVIPFIREKDLVSVFIQPFEERSATATEPPVKAACTRLIGSREPILVLGNKADKTAVTRDLFLGLYLFQENRKDLSVIVVPDASSEPAAQKKLDPSNKILVFSRDETEETLNQTAFAGISRSRFFKGLTKEEAALKCLSG